MKASKKKNLNLSVCDSIRQAPGPARRYPGGKNGAGVYQRLINRIPPHDVYIEPFLGSGAVMRNKKPADYNIGIDIDPDVTNKWLTNNHNIRISIHTEDARRYIASRKCSGLIRSKTFIYCDPPYIMETRKSGPLYRHEFSNDQHVKLLELLLSLDAMIMITGYRHKIYDDTLGHWRRMDYMAPTRQGMAKESTWMNFPEPTELHDYRYLGDDFRDRERISRKVRRWKANLRAMPPRERNAMLAALNSVSVDRVPE